MKSLKHFLLQRFWKNFSNFDENLTHIEMVVTALGLDGLTAEVYVSLDVICDRLTNLVNESLSSGVFPKILKAA